MVTKLKGWTAVKIICFILILALCFIVLNRLYAIVLKADETGINPDIVLSDLSANQYIYDRYMNRAHFHADIIAYFGSEEAINAGLHLRWVKHDQVVHEWDDSSVQEVNEQVSVLESADGRFLYSHLTGSDILSQYAREREEQNAIREQRRVFLNAQEFLSNMEGLLYYIHLDTSHIVFDSSHIVFDSSSVMRTALEIHDSVTRVSGSVEEFPWWGNYQSSGILFTNVDEHLQTEDYFMSLPVYYVVTGNDSPDFSSINHPHEYVWGRITGTGAVYLAFSHEFVNYQNELIAYARDSYINNLGIIAAAIVLALVLTVVLLIGAGKKYKFVEGEATRSERVHFSPLDKPYLDFSLFVVFCWTLAIAYAGLRLGSLPWVNSNDILVNVLFAAMSILIVPPVLYWLISFVKRLKAGRFWRHTLIYAILYKCLFGFLRFCIRKIKSLWAGTKLTLKVALISLASFIAMCFVVAVGSNVLVALVLSVIITAGVAVLLLLYARRIRNLEQGAFAASEGDYDTPIDAGGGELGSIASSINNISSGINTAVEERLKSERLKTELITNVSHDIRTPLTSIITYTDLLDHEGLDSKKAPEYLDVLKQKSQRLKTLTDELFEAAKAATGNIDVNLTDLNIVSLINQVLGELDSAIKTSGLDLRVNLPEKLMARADGRLMQRIMENLLSNVFRYSLSGSRVYLDALSTEDKRVRIDIKNISAAELNFDPSELTERFKRGDNSRTDGGSGLGLSIVQSFVSAQSGKLDISIDGDLFKATVLLPAPSPHTQT